MIEDVMHDAVWPNRPMVIYRLAISATMSGLLMGYDTAGTFLRVQTIGLPMNKSFLCLSFTLSTGIINGAIIILDEQFNLTREWKAVIVSSTIFSASVFSLISGIIADVIGRKFTIMMSTIVFSMGGGIMGLASGIDMLLVGRLIVGASIGVESSVVPIYVSECAPPDIRGRLITLNQLFITVGIMVSSLMSAGLQGLGETGWRWMLGITAVPGVCQFVCFFALPESPRFQMMKKHDVLALNTLRIIRGKQDVSSEMNEIRRALEAEEELHGVSSCPVTTVLTKIFKTAHVRKTLFIGCMLQVFQQLCGINTVITCNECTRDRRCGYCSSTDHDKIKGSCITIEDSGGYYASWGRCSFSNTTGTSNHDKITWLYGFCPSVYSLFALAGLILFVLSFAPGAGPMPWTINAEIYPSWCRSLANSLATLTNWTTNLIVSVTFLVLADIIMLWGTFLLLTLICIAGAVFVIMLVPETKDKTLEEIEHLFMNKTLRLEISDSSKSSSVESKRTKSAQMVGSRNKSVSFMPTFRQSRDGSTVLE